MNCTLDTNALILWSSTKTNELTIARLDNLFEIISKSGGVVILPTPAISELLIKTDSGTTAWLAALQRRSAVKVAPFDLRAAVECALISRLGDGTKAGKRAGTKPGEAYQKIKVDRQIAAIARVSGSDLLVTDDEGLIKICEFINIPTSRVVSLDLPASAMQSGLPFEAR